MVRAKTRSGDISDLSGKYRVPNLGVVPTFRTWYELFVQIIRLEMGHLGHLDSEGSSVARDGVQSTLPKYHEIIYLYKVARIHGDSTTSRSSSVAQGGTIYLTKVLGNYLSVQDSSNPRQ
jgi:hypothetical protein